MVAFQTTGDRLVFGADDPKAGALSLATSLEDFVGASTDPIDMFAKQDAFRTVAEFIATNMAQVPFNLYRRDPDNGRTKLRPADNPLALALSEPHPTTTQFRWIEALQLDMVLHDRWAAVVVEVDGRLQLVRLPARRVSFALDPLHRITHAVVWDAELRKKLPLPIERVLFDVGYDPRTSNKTTGGMPIAGTLAASANELKAGADWRSKLLSNGPKVPMYIYRPKDAPGWKKEDRERFETSMERYSDERAGFAPVLADGMEMRAAPQLLQDNVQYAETRKAAQIEFAIAMHIPPEVIGYREGTFSNLEAYREQVYIDVLGGRFAAFRQALNQGLRRADMLGADLYVEENLGARLNANPQAQAAVLQTQVGAPVRTRNEARAMLNLSPIEGGDDLIVPLNVTTGGLASPTDTAPKTLARIGGPSTKAIEAGPALSLLARTRDRFASDLRAGLAKQRTRILDVLGNANAPGSLADAFDFLVENEAIASLILPHSYQLALVGAKGVLDRFNEKSEGFDPELMLPWLTKASSSQATQLNTGTFRRLSERIVGPEWRTAVDELLAHVVDEQSAVWAQTIATASSSFGANDAAKASGLGVKTWRHSGGPDSRSSHAALDGETVALDEVFSNGMRWPGDPQAGADETASCHCSVAYGRGD